MLGLASAKCPDAMILVESFRFLNEEHIRFEGDDGGGESIITHHMVQSVGDIVGGRDLAPSDTMIQ